MTVAEKIKQCRDFLGLSQAELARRAGLTAPAICQYESGERTPDLKSFFKLVAAIGMNPVKFLEDIDELVDLQIK